MLVFRPWFIWCSFTWTTLCLLQRKFSNSITMGSSQRFLYSEASSLPGDVGYISAYRLLSSWAPGSSLKCPGSTATGRAPAASPPLGQNWSCILQARLLKSLSIGQTSFREVGVSQRASASYPEHSFLPAFPAPRPSIGQSSIWFKPSLYWVLCGREWEHSSFSWFIHVRAVQFWTPVPGNSSGGVRHFETGPAATNKLTTKQPSSQSFRLHRTVKWCFYYLGVFEHLLNACYKMPGTDPCLGCHWSQMTFKSLEVAGQSVTLVFRVWQVTLGKNNPLSIPSCAVGSWVVRRAFVGVRKHCCNTDINCFAAC